MNRPCDEPDRVESIGNETTNHPQIMDKSSVSSIIKVNK